MAFITSTDGGNGGVRRPSAAALKNGVKNSAHGLRSAARFLRRGLRHPAPAIQVSQLLVELATVEPAVALERLGSSGEGLTPEEAALRLEDLGSAVDAAMTMIQENRRLVRKFFGHPAVA
jgi:hypothetical protein